MTNGLMTGDPITFQIRGDLVDNSYPRLSLSNPPLIDSIQSGEDPFPIKQTPFKTTKITTDCKFYTLVRPDAEDKTGRFAPKGLEAFKSIGILDKNLVKNNDKDDNRTPAKTETIKPSVLLGGDKLTSRFGNNVAVNPPFRSCGAEVGDDGGQIATYIVRGIP